MVPLVKSYVFLVGARDVVYCTVRSVRGICQEMAVGPQICSVVILLVFL